MSRRSSDRFVACVLAIAMASAPIAIVAYTSDASADPSAADLDSARELYKAGLELRKNGDERGALTKFKGAYALSKSPVIGVDVGKSQMALGWLVEAREQFLDVDALAVSPKEGKASIDARAEATKLASEIKPRIPTITIVLSGPTSPPPKVTLDGATIPVAALGQPRSVNPGTHAIGISNGGPEKITTVTLTEGEVRDLPLAVPETKGVATVPTTAPTTAPTYTPPPAPTTTTTTTMTTTAAPTGERKTSSLVYVGFGIAGAGLLVGSITGAIALSKSSKVKDNCPHDVCPPNSNDDLDQAKTMATISTIGFAVAGAGVVLGIIGLATGSKHETPKTTAHIEPWIGAGSAGVMGAF